MSIIPAMGAEHLDHMKLMAVVATFNHPTTPNQKVISDVASLYGPAVAQNVKYQHRPFVAEEKFDGHSYIAAFGKFIPKNESSNGGYLDKTDKVPHLAAVMKYIHEMTGADIHVELYKPGGTSDDVTKIMGCDADKAILRQQLNNGYLHCMWVDIRTWKGMNLCHEPYYIRRAVLEWVYYMYIEQWGFGEFVHLAPVSLDPINDFRHIINAGGEGMIFKNTGMPYVPGKKPANNWIKAKKKITLDAVIMELNGGGSGKNKDLFKSIAVGLWFGNELRHIGDIHSGVSDELRRKMYDNFGAYKGRVVEVDAMEYNGKKLTMRHGQLVRFRDDKAINQCTEDGIRVKVDLI